MIMSFADEILMTMRQSSGQDRRDTIYAKNKTQTIHIAEEKSSTHYPSSGAKDLQAKMDCKSMYNIHEDVRTAPTKKSKSDKRRNSTGTIYVETTMSSQDNTSTIECVCVVIRAHMIAAAKENIIPLSEYDVFKDIGFTNRAEYKDGSNPMAMVSEITIPLTTSLTD